MVPRKNEPITQVQTSVQTPVAPDRIYVCVLCLYGAKTPKDHGYSYPRPGGVPGFHQHSADSMIPYVREDA